MAAVNVIWFALLLVIFYFLLIRPQQKAMKEHQQLIAGLKKGDKVISRGGLYGTIQSIGDDTVTLLISENVSVKIAKNSIEKMQV